MPTESKTTRTLKTLIRVGKALRDPAPAREAARTPVLPAVRQAAQQALHDPRLQGASSGLQHLRSSVGARVDQRLETLIGEARARRGESPPPEVAALLERRRQERDERLARLRARQALLSQARTPEQRRVLEAVAAVTPWAGGGAGSLRYTQLLDDLAPEGAAAEMAIHRALWTLAEQRVLAVSPHGLISAVQTLAPAAPALPGS